MKMRLLTLTVVFVASVLDIESLVLPSGFVVSSDGVHRLKRSDKEGLVAESQFNFPQIYEMYVKSSVSNRFAHTTVTSKVKNLALKAQEATFSVVLPENAFISGFIMEVGGKNYTAYVKEKEEAKKTYEYAVASGLGAAHVAVSARDSNRFTVSINVEPESKAAFYLTYEELLQRKNGLYEIIINLHPGQPIKNLGVKVEIVESQKIIKLRAPPLRSGNEIGADKKELDPRADIEVVNDTSAVVTFSPNLERQKQLAHFMGTKEEEGLSGQFVIQYDVERLHLTTDGGEILIKDNYFVHFFAPTELYPLHKHIVFILDTSSSMYNEKIKQLKEAMIKIVQDLKVIDIFHLVEFNTNVRVWDLDNNNNSVWYPYENDGVWGNRKEVDFKNLVFPKASLVTSDSLKKAIDTVSKFEATGSTDIYSALKIGLHLVEMTKIQNSEETSYQPMIVFLTDGEPTIGSRSAEEITNEITEFNSGLRKSPIFSLSFGRGADKKFLQKLSGRNSGFTKHIYEAADASLQLHDFYSQIAYPLLANVTFKYENSASGVTTTEFPLYFHGSEIAVTGCFEPTMRPLIDPGFSPGVHAWNGYRYNILVPTVKESPTTIERLWAYLTVKQLLEKKEISDKDTEELKKKALDLALKYSFVTSVSSLVVVKPNSTDSVDTETADKDRTHHRFGPTGPIIYTTAPIGQPGIPSVIQGVPGSSALDRDAFPDRDSIGYSYYSITKAKATPALLATTQPKIIAPPERSSNIFILLPWLKDIVNESGIISISKRNYKLGLNETISDNIHCPKTPLNAAGHCSLLHSCPQVYSLLTNVDTLVEHFCILKNEYAGVCCPYTA